MPKVPLISVLMPVFNSERYLASALESILTQTCTDFEVLVTDDGSTDETVRLARRYAAADSRIRFERQANVGITRTLNCQIPAARGKYLARMDGDDLSLPRRFEEQVRFLDEHSEHVLVGCRAMLIDPDGRVICPKRDTELNHFEIESLLLRGQWPLVHPAVMMRADVVRRLGGYDERRPVSQDHDLFLRLAEVGKLANVPRVLFHYRQHFQSVTFTKVQAQTHHVEAICREARARRGMSPPPDSKGGTVRLLTPTEHRRNWAWWALTSGNVSTARHHAAAVLRDAPFDLESWRLTLCVLRGY